MRITRRRTIALVLMLALVIGVLALPSASMGASQYTWTELASRGDFNPNSITATDANHFWVAGKSGGVNGNIVNYDTGIWTMQTGATASYGAIFALDSSHIWAVGNSGTNNTVQFYAGGLAWTPVTLPVATGQQNAVDALDETHVWSVGNSASSNAQVFYSNGNAYNDTTTAWTSETVTDGASVAMKSVFVVDANNVWGCGYKDQASPAYDEGYIFKRNSTTGVWETKYHLTDATKNMRLYSIKAIDSQHLWAVGWNGDTAGIVLYSDDGGTNWSTQAVPSGTSNLNNLATPDVTHAVAGGLDGTCILVWDGTTWHKQSLPGTHTADKTKGCCSVDNRHIFMLSGGSTPRDNIYTGALPEITGSNPPALMQGQTAPVVIIGANTAFAGTSNVEVTPVDGITVNGFTADSPTQITANITVAGSAAVGPRDINVITGAETPDPLVGGLTVIYNPNAPTVTKLTPMTAAAGAKATIDGTNFNISQGPGFVSFNGTKATEYASWSDTRIECTVPLGATSGPVTVTSPGGFTSNAVKMKLGSDTFYFAEGSCRPNFDTYVCIQNPGDFEAKVTVTFMKADWSVQETSLTVPAGARSTLEVNTVLGQADDPAHDFSIKVSATNHAALIVERPMYFKYRGMWTGGHDVIGVTSPGNSYLFAEGTCRPGFDPFISIQNPGMTYAQVTITYLTGDGKTKTQNVTVREQSRATVDPKLFLGSGASAAYDFSARVESPTPIVAERAMYFNYNGVWPGGHDVVGAQAAANSFLFAEGSVRPGIDPYFCIMNPNDGSTDVKLTYMFLDGTSKDQMVTVPGKSRMTVEANKTLTVADSDKSDFSCKVSTIDGAKIVVERPTYFKYENKWTGGHDVVGATAARTSVCFAEGTCRPNFDEYLTLLNPTLQDETATITYMMGDGSSKVQTLAVGKMSRATVKPADLIGIEENAAHDVSCKVESTGTGLVVERPMYFLYKAVWPGGSDVMGLPF
jgi:IPT/TIG domain/Family of unknown function (DUF5719)